MKQHRTGTETANGNGDVLSFPTSWTSGALGVRLTFDTDASVIAFEQVSGADRRSKLTVSHNGTWFIGKLSIKAEGADGAPAPGTFVTDWACPPADAAQAG